MLVGRKGSLLLVSDSDQFQLWSWLGDAARSLIVLGICATRVPYPISILFDGVALCSDRS